MQDLDKFEQYFGAAPDNATENQLATTLVVLNHCYWVQRTPPPGLTQSVVPSSTMTIPGTDPALNGWPRKTTDKCNSIVPFISDGCFAGYGTACSANVADININFANNPPLPPLKKSSGHSMNGSLRSVNVGFVDGHVDLHNRKNIQAVYNNSPSAYWFY